MLKTNSKKAADPGAGDRQLCHSRRPSPESRKVVRAKVVKVAGWPQSPLKRSLRRFSLHPCPYT